MDVLMFSRDSTAFDDLDTISYSNFPERLLEYSKYATIHVITCSKKAKKKKLSDKVFIYGVPSDPLRYVYNSIRISRQLKKKTNIDVITTQDPFLAGISGKIAQWIFKKPFIVQLHGDFLDNSFWLAEAGHNRLLNLLGKQIVKHSDAVRTVSSRVSKKVEKKLNKKAYVAPIYTDIKKYAESKEKPLKKFSKFDNVVLFVGRLVESKNIEMLLDTVPMVLQDHPNTAFVIVGDGPLRKKLEKQANPYLKNVFFEGATSKTPPYYKTCDFLVLPSHHEGWGLVLIESLASGKPVITTDVGCVGDIVINGENGIVIGQNFAKELADSISELIREPITREKMGKAGQQKVLTEISREKNAQEFMQILKKVAKQ